MAMFRLWPFLPFSRLDVESGAAVAVSDAAAADAAADNAGCRRKMWLWTITSGDDAGVEKGRGVEMEATGRTSWDAELEESLCLLFASLSS